MAGNAERAGEFDGKRKKRTKPKSLSLRVNGGTFLPAKPGEYRFKLNDLFSEREK